MRFEQAFYTWGKNQLSRHREGLGVCAASRLDGEFLDRCLTLGSRFNSERTGETAQIVLYAEEFGSFVAVGISPRADGGDGRVNKLCHFFIPAEAEEYPSPDDYLLNYPFQREVEDGEEIGTWSPEEDLTEGQEKCDYRGIMERYRLRGKRLAGLLQTAWPCMFGEISGFRILLGREGHEEDYDLRAAREITWLLSMLAPGSGDIELECRKNLSYGVRTRENMSAARILYTFEPGWGGQEFVLDQEPDEGELLPVFIRMAEYAERSADEYKSFTEGLLKMRGGAGFRCSHLPRLFLRWRLENGEYVPKQDVIEEIDDILTASVSSRWEREFMEEYLLQAEDLEEADILELWGRFVIPVLRKENPEESGDGEGRMGSIVRKLLGSIYRLNPEDYEKMLRRTPDMARGYAVGVLYEAEDSPVRKQLEKLSSYRQLEAFISLYSDICRREEVRDRLISLAGELYAAADRQEREKISGLMLSDIGMKERWDGEMRRYVERDADAVSFLTFAAGEAERVERRYVPLYYGRLLYFARKQDAEGSLTDDTEKLFSVCDSRLRGIAGEEIPVSEREEFRNLERKWEIRKINGKLRNSDLWTLAEEDPGRFEYRESRKCWIDCVVQKLRRGEHISDDVYKKLLGRIRDISYWKEIREIGQPSYDEYMSALWGRSDSETRESSFKRKIWFRLEGGSGGKYSVWNTVGMEDGLQDFELISKIFRENPEMASEGFRKEGDPASVRVKKAVYSIWESSSRGEPIPAESLRSLNGQTCKGQESRISSALRMIQKSLRSADGKQMTMTDFTNYLNIQKKRESIDQNAKKSQRERCRKYRKWNEQGSPLISFASEQARIQGVTDPWMEKRIREMQQFFLTMKFGKVTERNYKSAKMLLKQGREIFSDQIDEVTDLKQGCDNFREGQEKRLSEVSDRRKKIAEKKAELAARKAEIEKGMADLDAEDKDCEEEEQKIYAWLKAEEREETEGKEEERQETESRAGEKTVQELNECVTRHIPDGAAMQEKEQITEQKLRPEPGTEPEPKLEPGTEPAPGLEPAGTRGAEPRRKPEIVWEESRPQKSGFDAVNLDDL